MVTSAPFAILAAVLFTAVLVILKPNEAGVLVLFGRCKGTVEENWFWWVNPLISKSKISLRS